CASSPTYYYSTDPASW
nr:immunoglobulin heavy chain junction region [Macaca mulatta]MOV39401.1 immunoglobulin heavy chain junction region [Macaca mulatta]MOV39468.1 immunoglobulin heavy chain junction region [Macaca mulatta]MOV40130.1 immunoglobulin heavy chain junction region [Macaca mulatta]MOV40810.1 immunoglobulin heavy chain junction region [Macaca mulatta]